MMNLSPTTRAWAYGIAVAAFGVAFVYGLVEQEQIDAWLLLVAGVLGVGTNALAVKNVDPNK